MSSSASSKSLPVSLGLLRLELGIFFIFVFRFSLKFFKTSEIEVFSSSNSDNREIDEYHDSTSDRGSSSNSGSRSSDSSGSGGNTTNKQYTSGVPGFLWRFFRKSLGRGLLQDHMLVPPLLLLCPPP